MEQSRESHNSSTDQDAAPVSVKDSGSELPSLLRRMEREEPFSDNDIDTVHPERVKQAIRDEAQKLKEQLEAKTSEGARELSEVMSSLPPGELLDGRDIVRETKKELDHIVHETRAATSRLERNLSEEIFDINSKKWTKMEKRRAMDTALQFWGDLLRPVKNDIVLYASTTTYLQGRMMEVSGIDPKTLKDEYTKYPGDLDIAVATESTLKRIQEFLMNSGLPIRYDNPGNEKDASFDRYPDGSVRLAGTIDIPLEMRGKIVPFPYEFELFFEGSDRFLGKDLQKRKIDSADAPFGLPILQEDAHKIQYGNNLRFETKIGEVTEVVANELRKPETHQRMEKELAKWHSEMHNYRDYLKTEPKGQEHIVWEEGRKTMIREMNAFAGVERFGLSPEEIQEFYALEEMGKQTTNKDDQKKVLDAQTRYLSGGFKSKAEGRRSVLDALIRPFQRKKK